MTTLSKYAALERLMVTNWSGFLEFRAKVSLDKLDYKTLMCLLASNKKTVSYGAKLLLILLPIESPEHRVLLDQVHQVNEVPRDALLEMNTCHDVMQLFE